MSLLARPERSFDLQSFLIEDDRAGAALLAEIDRAASRGTRIRLLLDDSGTAGRCAQYCSN